MLVLSKNKFYRLVVVLVVVTIYISETIMKSTFHDIFQTIKKKQFFCYMQRFIVEPCIS